MTRLTIFLISISLISLPFLNNAHASDLYSSNIPNEGIHIIFGGGWGFFSPDDINELNELIANDKIKSGVNLKAGVAGFISRRLSVGLDLQYITSGIDYESNGESWEMSYSALLRVVVAESQIRYYFPLANVDYFLGANEMVCFADYRNNRDYLNQNLPPMSYNWNDKYHGVGIGLSITSGIRKEFNRIFCIDVELGYRYLGTGSLNGKSTSTYALHDHLHPAIDLSGPTVIAEISYRIR
jgi:hypothetical protein